MVARQRVSPLALLRERPGLSTGAGLVLFSIVFVRLAGTRPGFDPYGWLVWGHQTLQWNLNTNGAPSWKPLPYLFTVPYNLFGHYALWLWMTTAAAISLSGVLFAGRIAYRLTGGAAHRNAALAAGLFAGLGLLGITGYMHYILSAQSDTMIVALCLGAIDCALSGRPRIAFAMGVLASLGRPEVWPFLGLYALWAFRTIPRMRALIVAGLALIPLMWFGIPAITSTTPFVAGDLALHSSRALHHHKFYGVIDRFLDLHEWPLQLAALLAAVLAAIRRDRTALLLAAGVITWVAIEIAFAYHGWPAIDRYMFEAAGVMVVLAGVAVGWVLAHSSRWVRVPSWTGILVVALLAGGMVPAAVSRVRTERKDLYRERARTRQIGRLQSIVARLGGASRILACGQPIANIEFQSITAWTFGINVGFVGYRPRNEVRQALRGRKRIVLFTPVKYGWRARAIYRRGTLPAACVGLRAATATG